jgi:hypothetical protein
MKEKILKEFSEWLNEEDRNNWEIERYVEAMLDNWTLFLAKEIGSFLKKNLKI